MRVFTNQSSKINENDIPLIKKLLDDMMNLKINKIKSAFKNKPVKQIYLNTDEILFPLYLTNFKTIVFNGKKFISVVKN